VSPWWRKQSVVKPRQLFAIVEHVPLRFSVNTIHLRFRVIRSCYTNTERNEELTLENGEQQSEDACRWRTARVLRMHEIIRTERVFGGTPEDAHRWQTVIRVTFVRDHLRRRIVWRYTRGSTAGRNRTLATFVENHSRRRFIMYITVITLNVCVFYVLFVIIVMLLHDAEMMWWKRLEFYYLIPTRGKKPPAKQQIVEDVRHRLRETTYF